MSQDTTFEALQRGATPRATGTVLIGLLRRLARPLRRGVDELQAIAREAAEVRAMAYRLQHQEPGFAADLLAAADRHEQQFGR